MKRLRVFAPAHAVSSGASLVLPAAAALALVLAGQACIPDPDISGLPPYDGGLLDVTTDVTVTPPSDANTLDVQAVDTGTPVGEGGGNEAAAGGLVTITGKVVNYTEGKGQGVIPGAVVTTADGLHSATSDGNGAFTINGIPVSGDKSNPTTVILNVTKATDKNLRLAYSSTGITLSLAGTQTVNVFPVLHVGCYAVIPAANAAQSATIDLTTACASSGTSRPNAKAALTFKSSSFSAPNAPNPVNFRVEMIPLSYAASTPTDLSWAIGLPGAATQPGMIGGAEFRVYDDDTNQELDVAQGAVADVIGTIPLYRAPGQAELPVHPAHYDNASGGWAASTNALNATTFDAGVGGVVTYDVHLDKKGWWGVAPTQGPQQACFLGSILQGSTPVRGMLVRAVGENFLGSSTAVTDSTGGFCINVPSTGAPDAGAAKAIVLGGYLDTSGTTFVTATTLATVATAPSSCSSASPTCTQLGPIHLQQVGSCSTGTIANAQIPNAAAVELQAIPITTPDNLAGIESSAYVGYAPIADGGAFCAVVPTATGAPYILYDPDSGCQTSRSPAPSGNPVGACGGANCSDAGLALPWNCP